MAKPIKLSTKKINEIMASDAVRDALERKAARVLPRARAIAYSSEAPKLAAALETVPGTRPGTNSPTGLKRPYVRVGAVLTDEIIEEGKRARLSRVKILRRASNG